MEIFQDHGIVTHKNTIKGILARLYPVKGVDIFIRAAHRYYRKGQMWNFFIAGDGEEKEKLKSYHRN